MLRHDHVSSFVLRQPLLLVKILTIGGAGLVLVKLGVRFISADRVRESEVKEALALGGCIGEGFLEDVYGSSMVVGRCLVC